MEHANWLTTGLIYLAAAVIAVPLARALGLGSIIGYLAAGIVIGPWGLALVTDAQTILSVAEFGVVLMLFLIGMELEPRRLWAMRRPIFGWGAVQMGASAALMVAVAATFGVPWTVALAAALGLALSSTAIGLAVLGERNALPTPAGQGVLAIALFQDVAAIPILALLPLLGAQAAAAAGGGWLGAAKAVAVIAALLLGGRLLLRPALRWIARSRTPEIFTAASLLLVVATAALMHAAGLSMALGAFLAGVLLAESEYRRELETDLEPFKGLLLGLFFIAVGMSIDFAVVFARPGLVAAIVLGFLVLKTLVLLAMARAMPVPLAERPLFTILLAQGGEFGFVVFQAAQGAAVFDAPTASLLVAAVALSMLVTPLALAAVDRWLMPRLAARGAAALPEIDEPQDGPVIIAGFGRYGQIIGRLLMANGIQPTVLEHDSEQVESVRRFGWRAFYGDATRLDLLRMAGADKARVLVLAIDDEERSLDLVDLVHQHFPRLQVVARARNVQHWYQLQQRGVAHIERETFDSALMSGRSVLELMGFERHQARNLALRFRRHNLEQLAEAAPHFKDESKLIAMAKIGRQQMEQFMADERRRKDGGAAGEDSAGGEGDKRH
ncbi:MAG TPA: glutathione-regulated potassium-efflux system protein KefC [Burkholderiaceae bacterium]|nr:glutathione-regulated potassium-efflux system protein KefC [Burkholderiaceae bacterium]